MSSTQFVLMYHPLIAETIEDPVLVSLSSVDDHAARGWLLVDPDAEPPVVDTPYYTTAAADSRFLTEAAARAAFGLVYLVPAPTGTAAVDQAAIQSVIDEAADDGGGIVDLRDGAYAMNAELILKERVLVRGQGIQRTRLTWSTDLGSGKFGVRQDVGAGFQVDAPAMAELSIIGPSNSVPLGTSPANMDGWQIGRNVGGTNVEVKGFHAGGVFIGDHNTMTTCLFVNCYYNALFPSTRLTSGNQVFIGCSFTGGTFAGIAVEGNISLDSSIFVGGHMGFSPYCFYKFGTGATSAILSNSVLNQLAFESVGNGAFLDESTTTGSSLSRCTIDEPGFSWDAAYRIAARAKDYAVDVYSITDTYLRGTFPPGDVASFNVRGGFDGMKVEYSGTPPTFVCPTAGPGPLLDTKEATARYLRTSAAVTVRDLLEGSGETVAPYGTLSREYAGVALASAASGGWVPVAYKGRVSVGNGATGIGAGGTPVGIDPAAPTKVRPLSSTGSNGYTFAVAGIVPSKHPVIGRTDRDIPASGTGNIWLNDPAPDRMYVAPGAVTALPTASATYRGQVLRLEGAAGVADGLYICMKDAANAYAWKLVTVS